MANKPIKKNNFTRKAQEYLDDQKLPEGKEKEYYDKFNFEYYDNNVNKHNLENQLHNTENLVDEVYSSCNARNRDLLSTAKVTKQLTDLKSVEDVYTPTNEDDEYLEMLKVEGYNNTLKRIFEDYSHLLLESNTIKSSSYLLKTFYISLGKLNREQKRWVRQEKKLNGKKEIRKS